MYINKVTLYLSSLTTSCVPSTIPQLGSCSVTVSCPPTLEPQTSGSWPSTTDSTSRSVVTRPSLSTTSLRNCSQTPKTRSESSNLLVSYTGNLPSPMYNFDTIFLHEFRNMPANNTCKQGHSSLSYPPLPSTSHPFPLYVCWS